MAKKSSNIEHKWCWCCGGSFWGWFLLLLGVWLLAKEFGWIASDFSIWPVVWIVIGVYLLTRKRVCY